VDRCCEELCFCAVDLIAVDDSVAVLAHEVGYSLSVWCLGDVAEGFVEANWTGLDPDFEGCVVYVWWTGKFVS